MENAPVPARIAMMAALGVMTFFAMTNNPIKGLWIGPTREAMVEELEAVDTMLRCGKTPDGAPVSMSKLITKSRRLAYKISCYDAANSKRSY